MKYIDSIKKFNENNHFKNNDFNHILDKLEDSNIEHEKNIVDFFGVSLSSIEKISNNFYSVDTLSGVKEVYFFKKSDLIKLKELIIDRVKKEIKETIIDIDSIGDFWIKDVIEEEKLVNRLEMLINNVKIKDFLQEETGYKGDVFNEGILLYLD